MSKKIPVYKNNKNKWKVVLVTLLKQGLAYNNKKIIQFQENNCVSILP